MTNSKTDTDVAYNVAAQMYGKAAREHDTWTRVTMDKVMSILAGWVKR